MNGSVRRTAANVALTMGALMWFGTSPAAAATVTSGADSGPGTLRDVVAAAPAGDTITFAPAVTTVTLTTAQITLTKNVKIQGNASPLTAITRDGAASQFRIFAVDPGVTVTMDHVWISNGNARGGGGIDNDGTLTITHSRLSSNVARTDTGGGNSGGAIRSAGTLTVDHSSIEDNAAPLDSGRGGGIAGFASTTVRDTLISGNDAGRGGAVFTAGATTTIARSLIRDNTASDFGGGIALLSVSATIERSELSGNEAATGEGGGIQARGSAVVDLSNITLAANIAAAGGALQTVESDVALRNSTVVGNTTTAGAALEIAEGDGGATSVQSTIVGGQLEGTNCSGVSDAGNNLQFGDSSCAGFTVADPLLGPLADNGGPSRTMAITSPTSPAVNTGSNCVAAATDQRGVPRGGVCDIGAYEYSRSLPAVVRASTQWILGVDVNGSCCAADFTYGARPQVPVMGDWDGDGTRTAGRFEGGTFKLRNSNSSGAADVTFAFGDPRGFPVAGDFDGDRLDDVAIYRNGLWQLRLSTGVTSAFTYGSGGWPNTVPVAGDWDGDGIDGIGTYTLATGAWNLRNAVSAGPPDIGPFVFWSGAGSYPVVGEWDGDGRDTAGVKNGVTWALNNANDASAADITFDLGQTNDLPLSWR